jgi:post-segregation antitoxin (ccd killing protein)
VEIAMKQNITITLDKETIRKAKVLAADRGSSVSRVLSEELERLVGEQDRYQAAKTEAIAELRRGYRLGGGPLPHRDEIYER